ncbi:MAG: mechanosensitive ion channel family protein [Myxococcota bacterium]|nr:mechanosensitive ion channel family protein [Myxococcota bacterium]
MNRSQHRIALLTALACCLLLPQLVFAAPSAEQLSRCSNPRQATQTWIDNLQKGAQGNYDSDLAILCFDFSAGPEDYGQRVDTAQKLLDVLDGQGKFVDYNRIPLDSEYTDPSSGLTSYTLFSSLPDIRIERREGVWLVSTHSIASAERLFDSTYTFALDRWVKEWLPPAFNQHFVGLPLWRWVGLIAVLLLALVLGKLSEWVIIGSLRKLFQRLVGNWDKVFEQRLLRRFNLLVTASITSILLPSLTLGVRLNQALLFAAKLIISIAAVMIVTGLLDLLFDSWLRRASKTNTKMDDQLIPLLRRAAKTVAYVVGILFILQNLDIDVGSVLAGLGIGGLAFALAAKDTLANLFGSLTIFTDRPFQIGDWVVVNGIEGTVEEVGFRATRIRTFYDSVVTVPNSAVADGAIDNMGKRRYRRFKTTLGLTYDTSADQMQAFVEGVRASILASPYTRSDSYEVHFNSMGDFSLNVLVYAFFDVETWREELQGKHNLMLEWMRLAEELGLSFAYPTQSIQVETLEAQGQGKGTGQRPREDYASLIRSYGPEGDRSTPQTPHFTEGFWPKEG